MRQKKSPKPEKACPPSREQEMRAEILRLRQALEYSELRNEALNEVLKIGREEYGVDLLKKLAPSSKQPSSQASQDLHRMPVLTVWQKPGRILFGKFQGSFGENSHGSKSHRACAGNPHIGTRY